MESIVELGKKLSNLKMNEFDIVLNEVIKNLNQQLKEDLKVGNNEIYQIKQKIVDRLELTEVAVKQALKIKKDEKICNI